MDLEHLRASDGTGEAVLAHIDAPRNPGSTVLSLDNVDNWNSKAVVVTGTPAANGFIAAAGMKVMYGHITAGDFIIDGFAPGYADNGNTTQEIAIVKMTTSWADALVSILQQSLQNSGLLKTTSLDHFFKPSELASNFIASGGVVAQTVTLTGSFSDIVYYINGLRYSKTAVANKVYTASKDTYVDIGTDGVVDYTEVANGAASPALVANHVRIAKVVTSGAAITSVTQTGYDSLGNQIYRQNPINFATLSNPYKMRVEGGTTFTVGGGASAVVIFSTKTYDPNNNYDTATGEYTAPVSGYYRIAGHLRMDSSMATGLQMIFRVNGVLYKQAVQHIGQAEQTVLSGTDLLYCPAGGKISMWYYNGSGNTNIFRNFDSGLSVEFAGP